MSRSHAKRVRFGRGYLLGLLLAGAVLAPGCGGGSDGPCDRSLEAAVRAQGRVPRPDPPELPEPLVYADATRPEAEGLVVDPRPLARGQHPVRRYWRPSGSCEVVGGTFPWGPPPPMPDDAPAAPTSETIAAPEPAGSVHALLATGPDPGAGVDAQAWREALDALGASGLQIHAPSVETFRHSLRTLCADLGAADTMLLITTGRASPAAGGSWIHHASGGTSSPAAEQATSWTRLAGWLTGQCSGAGHRVWVVDAGYAGELPEALAPEVPTTVWRASDAGRRQAPRIRPAGGGLLSGALARGIAEGARRACLAERSAVPGEVLRSLPDPEAVRARMRALRWEAVGRPALDDLDGSPERRRRLAEALEAGVPRSLRVRVGEMDGPKACQEDADCPESCGSDAPCRTLRCVDGLCLSRIPVGAPCEDGRACTENDRCQPGGTCRGTPRSCDDGNPCTASVCIPGEGCRSTPVEAGTPCDDGDPCTVDDQCTPDGTCKGQPRDCDDGDPCTEDACSAEAGCVHEVTRGPCDDGDPCTVQDLCKDGVCRGTPRSCDDGNPCTVDTCDAEGECSHTPKPKGTPCDDGDPCTVDDRCVDGSCTGDPKSCYDGLDCTTDLCDEGVCEHLPEPKTCATDQGCIEVGESPADAPCLVCEATDELAPAEPGTSCPDDGVPCTADRCEGGTCVHPPEAGFCTGPDGTCVEVGEPIRPCLRCTATGTAALAEVGKPCDDGDPCTHDTTCSATGSCEGLELGCCPLAEEVSCSDGLVSGDTSVPEARAEVTNWGCYDEASLPAPERAHPFEAPCAGDYVFALEGPPGSKLLVIEGSETFDPQTDGCDQGFCQAHAETGVGLPRTLEAGERLLLVVDGEAGASGSYDLAIDCPCGSGG